MTAQLLLGAGGVFAAAAAILVWDALTRDPGTHAAPRGRAAITFGATIPVTATRGRPPWDDPGPLRTRPRPVTPAAHAAARAWAAWLVRETRWRAEAQATRPWADDTGTFTAICRAEEDP